MMNPGGDGDQRLHLAGSLGKYGQSLSRLGSAVAGSTGH